MYRFFTRFLLIKKNKTTMNFSIIISKKDLAGLNIYNQLKEKEIENLDNVEIIMIEEDSIFFDKKLDCDYVIFATRHQSKTGEKTLSLHFPGNLGIAEFGGEDKSLCMSAPNIAKQAFRNLNKSAKNSDYLVTLEATHHGPFIKTPCFFIEIGSKKEQWQDKKAGNIIAQTIIETITNFKPEKNEIAIGFGGTHYCNNFNKIELETDVAMSHICPKYNIESIDKNTIQNMIDSTKGNINYALLDWKGLNSDQKTRLIDILEKMNLSWKKTKDI